MTKKKQPQNTTKRSAREKMNDAIDTSAIENQNYNHNIKKESLGPNTKR